MAGKRFLTVALATGALVVAGCGGGDDEASEGAEGADAPAGIEFATVESLTPEYFDDSRDCGEGAYSEKDPIYMIPDEFETLTEPAQAWDCPGREEQIAYAQFDDPAAAEALLEEAFNAASLVAGDTAVLVNYGAEEDFDIAGFFKAIQAECDCGETLYSP